jgi:sucrose-6F-phosphate phosphohydrolase
VSIRNSPPYRPAQPDSPFLLAADVDGTLLGDEQGMGLLKSLVETHRRSFRLAYVTGRYLHSVRQLVEEGHLPAPDYVCSNVGTDIFSWNDPENTIGRKYAARISPDWSLDKIYARGVGPGVWLQDFGEDQPPFQAGFFWDGLPESLEAFRRRLANHGGLRILPSYGEFIDILPLGFGKGEAVIFLQQELGLDPQRVVVAGDSGNDAEMFLTGFQGILPANALEELKAVASQPWHYQSPYAAARGVLDGLLHFGFLKPAGGSSSA